MHNILFDKKLRAQIRKNPKITFDSNSYLDKNIDIVVKTNTSDTIYVILPIYNKNIELENVNAGVEVSSIGTVGTGGTASTVGCVAVTISSATTASSVSTVGSIGG